MGNKRTIQKYIQRKTMIICRQPIHRLFLGLDLESTVTESGALAAGVF